MPTGFDFVGIYAFFLMDKRQAKHGKISADGVCPSRE